MTKDILINISGLQMDVDPNDLIEMMTQALHTLRNGKHYILCMMNLKTTRSKMSQRRAKERELTRKGEDSLPT